jgi:hypothetical protein
MNAIINDRSAFRALDPLVVATYLRSTGWAIEKKITPIDGQSAYFYKPSSEGEPFEIQLVLNRELRDFDRRMASVLDTLAIAEHRSQLDVYRDLLTTEFDVVRIQLLAKESNQGTIPINRGVELNERARDLILASALWTVKPRIWYRRNPASQAEEYLRSVRLGQMDVGNYVITILSRVPPSFSPNSLELAKECFERRVTTNLARSIEWLGSTAEEAAMTGHLEKLRNPIQAGVSVNLCEALAGLAPDPKNHDGIKLEFTWSSSRPQRLIVPSAIQIPSTALDVIAEAGKMLRNSAPLEDVKVTGRVVRLDSGGAKGFDVATIRGPVGGVRRRVRVHVGEHDRAEVIRAFQDRLEISCTGDISRTGDSWVMADHAQIRVESNPTLFS